MKIKQMLLISILSLALLVSLTSCIAIPRYRYYKIDSETVSSIEIYDLRNSDTHYSGFLKTETPVYAIEQEQITDFLKDLSDIRFSDTIIITIAAIDPSFYYDDWVARINYTNGSYTLISCGGYGQTYDENDEAIDGNHFGCDDDEWEQFIGSYVPKDIFDHSSKAE